jgi:hypothetical protein
MISYLKDKGNFKEAKDLMTSQDELLDENLFFAKVQSYQNIVLGLQLVLRYSSREDLKITAYSLFNKLTSKQGKSISTSNLFLDSDFIGFEESFCSVDGINILLTE